MGVGRLAAWAVLGLWLTSCATTTTSEAVWSDAGNGGARIGRVTWVRQVVRHTEGNPAAGAAAGAVVGGVLGAALTGRPLGTVAGAATGAVVGAGVSQGQSETRTYDVAVQFDDGGQRVFRYLGYPPFRPGQTVALTPHGLMGQYTVAPPTGSIAANSDAPSDAQASPTTSAPEEMPPPPPPPPGGAAAGSQAPPVPDGQWVYTAQYGWIWMPYGDQYTFTPAYDYGDPYMYVYYPAFGWTWVDAPWLWGWGVVPYFSVAVGTRFGWYGRGWGMNWRGGHRSIHYRDRSWTRARAQRAPYYRHDIRGGGRHRRGSGRGYGPRGGLGGGRERGGDMGSRHARGGRRR